MKVACFITVRMASSRLPGKAMMEIKGKPIIEHLIDWIKRAKSLDEIVLCTTENKEDDILIEVAKRNNIKWHRGSEKDIIARHLGAVKKFDVDFIINAECDAIWYETKYINDIVGMARKNGVYDVILTTDLPNGVNIYGYKKESLEAVLSKSIETGWLEMLYTDKNLNQGYVSVNKEYQSWARMTMDYPEDFEFFKAIYNEFDRDFGLIDIVKKLKEKPDLIDINLKVDENYWANFNREKMRFLIIGLGSMGKRRIRNLRALGFKNIVGYDISLPRRKEVDIRTYNLLDEALRYEPNAIIISTPPDKHERYQRLALDNEIPFFTEASVLFEHLKDVIWFQDSLPKKTIGIPSCTMRFHPAIKKIKELIDTNRIGKPLTFTYHSGSYLPEWHPNDDPTNYYAYDKKQGAAREIVPFELSWLTWIFGDIKSVKSYYKETMNWGIDDIYQILIEFESGIIGHLLVDVVSREWIRKLEVMGSEGIIEWDWNRKRVALWNESEYFLLKDHTWEYFSYNSGTSIEGYNPNIMEEMYIEELNHFINCILGKEIPQYTLEEDLKILKILEDIESNER